MRLFLAIELSDAARRILVNLSSRSKRGMKDGGFSSCSWVRPENLHVTLKFFGEVPETQVARLCDALGEVAVYGPMRLTPARMECLPPRGPVRVIAVGLDGDLTPLHDLHHQIERKCQPLGFPSESRQFRPHVTLARARRPLPANVRRQLDELAAGLLPAPPMLVSEFVLMESQLNPQAAQYIPLARFPFREL